jgi:hypothetical protein
MGSDHGVSKPYKFGSHQVVVIYPQTVPLVTNLAQLMFIIIPTFAQTRSVKLILKFEIYIFN